MAWSLQQKPIGLALLVFGKLACLTSFFYRLYTNWLFLLKMFIILY